MFKLIRKLKSDRLPKKALEELKPRKEFKESLKVAFLSAYSAKFRTAPTSFVLKIATQAVFALFVCTTVLGVTAAYADATNASPSAPILYPLKRYAETVRVVVTPAANQPALHLELAKRRIDDIESIRKEERGDESATSTPKIQSLMREVKDEVHSSLSADSDPKIENRLKPICRFLDDAEKHTASDVEDILESNVPSATSSFRHRCAALRDEKNNDTEDLKNTTSSEDVTHGDTIEERRGSDASSSKEIDTEDRGNDGSVD